MLNIKKRIFIILMSVAIMSFFTISYAHSGRTDSNGGHKDNKNKSGLGGYHYHCNGNPAHLHTNGYCPYSYNESDVELNDNVIEVTKPFVPEKELIENEEQKQINEERIESEVIVPQEENIIEEKNTENKEEKDNLINKFEETKDVENEEKNKINEEKIETEVITQQEENVINENIIELEEQTEEKEVENDISVTTSVKESYDEEIIQNDENSINEIKDESSNSGLGSLLILGGAGYFAYKKIRG